VLLRALDSFRPRRQPLMTRQAYAHELVASLTLPVALAMIEGGVVGVLAKKAFDVTPLMFATIMASPMFANITSFLWARLARGRQKVRFIRGLMVVLLVVVSAIAVLPTTPAGAMALTGLIIVGRCLLAGIISLRSTVWRSNYPRHVRASMTGKLTLIQSLIIAISPVLGYAVLDQNPQAFRVIYPLSVIVAAIGVLAFARVRMRQERELLRYERQAGVQPTRHGLEPTVYEYDPQAGPQTFWQVLRHDGHFRFYMICQFLAGAANMMGETVIVAVIADATMLLTTLTLPLWAKRLDKLHVAHFRVRQSWFWISDQAFNWLGATLGSLPVIAVARVIQGCARGGGILAWQLGHNDFANRQAVALYMGVHQTLTGIRGAIAPFLGMALYAGIEGGYLPFDGIGSHVFLVTFTSAVLSSLGFYLLSRQVGREAKATA